MNDHLKTTVLGAGWLDAGTFGCVRRSERTAYGGKTGIQPPWQNAELLGGPVKNIGRFDAVSRLTCCACALALRDAGLSAEESRKLDIGILGTNTDGSLDANRSYFSDYLKAGRKLGSGHLFIYTLPTSPLAEATIHFGLKACNLYIGHDGGGAETLLDDALLLIEDGQAARILAVKAASSEAICLLLGPGKPGSGKSPAVNDVRKFVAGEKSVNGVVSKLEKIF